MPLATNYSRMTWRWVRTEEPGLNLNNPPEIWVICLHWPEWKGKGRRMCGREEPQRNDIKAKGDWWGNQRWYESHACPTSSPQMKPMGMGVYWLRILFHHCRHTLILVLHPPEYWKAIGFQAGSLSSSIRTKCERAWPSDFSAGTGTGCPFISRNVGLPQLRPCTVDAVCKSLVSLAMCISGWPVTVRSNSWGRKDVCGPWMKNLGGGESNDNVHSSLTQYDHTMNPVVK
jgi:hypothetical protein